MNQTTKNPIIGFIAIFETILVFIVGVLGNKVAEGLSMSGSTLLLLTGIGLGTLAVVSYTKIDSSRVSTNSSTSIKRLIPKTMVGIFPFGMFLGLVFGSLIPPLASTNSFIDMPNWIASILGYKEISLTGGEFAGILGGCVACILFALIVDSHLAGSFLVGYGLAFATATIVGQTGSASNFFLTYVGDGLVFVTLSVVLIAIEPLFSRFRRLATEPRV